MTTSNKTITKPTLRRQLPFYIEHNLVQQMLKETPPWQPDQTDFTWQAICRYYDLVLKHVKLDESVKDVKALRQWLAAGNMLEQFDYPFEWDSDQIAQLRDCREVAYEFGGLIAAFSNKSKPAGTMIPLDGFEAHMNKFTPKRLLTITRLTGIKKYPLWIFDDGQFKTAEACCSKKMLKFEDGTRVNLSPPVKVKMHHRTLDSSTVRDEIWRRWETGSKCAPPQDIQTDDGVRHLGIDCIAAFMPDYLKQFDQVKAILKGLSRRRKGQKPIVKAVAAVLDRWRNADPTGITAKYKTLSKEQQAFLLFYGEWTNL